MLDDLKLIHVRDTSDALGLAEKQWQQLRREFDTATPPFESIDNIVLTGMGGSVLPGVFLRSWPGTLVPLEIVRDYTLPSYVGAKTLVIVSSYSGNTEEALAAMQDAEQRNAHIVVVTAGGKLMQAAIDKRLPVYEVPAGIQPRMSSFYLLAAFVQILEPLGLIPMGSQQEMRVAAGWLADQVAIWRPDVTTAKNPPKQLALELMGKSVVIYSGPRLFPAANKWKICFNENAKNIAWANQYSEFNHNEFIGWTGQPANKPYAIVEIRSDREDPRIQKRFDATERLLSGKRPAPHVVKPHGETLLQQLLWAANFGDFTSLYLAILNGVDPTPVELMERLKSDIAG